MTRIKDSLLNKLDCNVILVHWSKGSLPPYVQATGNTRLVGAMIAELIKFLISQTQGSADLFHVVGFSLGAQTAGYTGRRLKQAGLTLGRITGKAYNSLSSVAAKTTVCFNFVSPIRTNVESVGQDTLFGIPMFCSNPFFLFEDYALLRLPE